MSNLTTNLDSSCGTNFTCGGLGNPSCYLLQTGPVCSDSSRDNNNRNFTWRLNPSVFPPIEYLGRRVGGGRQTRCVGFNYSSWSQDNKTWLLEYLRYHWVPNNSSSFISNNDTLPPGSFINPLDYIGSCMSSYFCSNGTCILKYPPQTNCNSSIQCDSFACGNLTIVNTTNIDSNMTFNCVDNSSILLQLTANYSRPWNVNLLDQNPNSPPGREKIPTYSSQAVAVIVLIIIILTLVSIGCCIKRFNSTLRPTNLDRSAGGRVHRTASLLVGSGGGGLTREDSVRTLPPYTEMADEPSDQQGVISTFTRYFFPPGELPPPYEDVHSDETRNEDIRRISTLNYISDVHGNPTIPVTTDSTTLDEVRDGVTFRDLPSSEPISRRSTITRNDGTGVTPLVSLQVLPEAGATDSRSFENVRDQVDETTKLNDNNDN
ncbi:22886_t:CDS:1 [Cetraspora pellucida]|uniref:22886_t:CDS:1 n=1 Tax=Cetraspora pellucida TaxID=1433469 RepID=A0A9N9ETR3_9GLOM|nr:22886_t:CDS:1 [Cetraspora pellucida]